MLLRGLTERRLSRRGFLRAAGVGTGALALAACGVSGTAPPTPSATGGSGGASGSPSPEDLSSIYGDGTPAGTLNFANWEDYIDVDAKGNSPTLNQFTKETGIKVDYKTVIPDNDPFLARIIPSLQAGQDTGFDLIVITNGGPVERMNETYARRRDLVDVVRLFDAPEGPLVALHTPGHSPGHVMFHIASERTLIGGDLIICDAVGRTDLPDSDPRQLDESIRKVMKLPPETRLLPGHCEPSTLGEELETNPYVRQALAR